VSVTIRALVGSRITRTTQIRGVITPSQNRNGWRAQLWRDGFQTLANQFITKAL
jgi:hypothetical protein